MWEEVRHLDVQVRPIQSWPGKVTRDRVSSPFSVTLGTTVGLLGRELRLVGAKRVVLGLSLSESKIRNDGFPRADARTDDPRVTLGFDDAHGEAQFYACDRWLTWQDNLRGIALGLEALRKVERYGIAEDGKQYRGFKALPGKTMGREEARDVLVRAIGANPTADGRAPVEDLYRLDDRELRVRGLRAAHPDLGGDANTFEQVKMAVGVLAKMV